MTDKTSQSPESKESAANAPETPKVAAESVEPKAKPKPKPKAREPYAVIGTGKTDPIVYSKAKVPGHGESRKSLTVLHLQRRLEEEGFSEAASAPGGRYETLTTRAVQAYQASIKADPTGVLTREQFAELFKDDPNVTVSIDTHEDHPF